MATYFLAAFVIGLVSASSALTTVTFHDDPEYGDKGTTWRVATCVRMNLDAIRYAEGAKLSSDDGQTCVVTFALEGCQGKRTEVRDETVNIQSFNKARSMSPCGSYQPDPETTDEQQQKLIGRFTRRVKTDLVSVYGDDSLAKSKWFIETIPKAAEYVNRTYGPIGTSGANNYLIFLMTISKVMGTKQKSAYEAEEGFRNVVRVYGEGLDDAKEPGRPEVSLMMDSVWNSMGCLLDQANNNVYSQAVLSVWQDCISFAHIFKYDLYLALGYKDDAARVRKDLINYKRNEPRNPTFWGKDWLLPIYEKYGQAKVYDKFMKLLAQNYPTKDKKVNEKDVGKEYSRRMNMGEFVHFFSGAAGESLKEMATRAFGWDNNREADFQKAKTEFGKIKYSG